MKQVNQKVQTSSYGDRNWVVEMRGLNIWKLARDTGMEKNGMAVKRGKTLLSKGGKNDFGDFQDSV